MSKDSAAVAWVKKMADALGTAVDQGKSGGGTASAGGGAPATGAAPTGGGAPAGGAPTSGGGPPSASGKPAPTGTPGGGAAAPPKAAGGTGDGKPATNGQAATDAPAGKTPAAAPAAGSGAKGYAESAQKSLAEVNSIATESKPIEGEVKKFATEAQTGKKKVDDAKRQADAAEKSLGKPPALAKPTGNDPKAQYDSAIQITGNTRKSMGEAETKEATVREQAGNAEVAAKSTEVAAKEAKKNADKLQHQSENAESAANSADTYVSLANQSAAESKKKADQAVKDKAADKDALVKTAQEDAKFAAAAKDAATKAHAAAKQLSATAKNAATQSQTAEKASQDSKTAAEAAKKQASTTFDKIMPYLDASVKAETQEADCRAKLSPADADEILRKRYEALGGDPELTKVMAAEDKAFETITEQHRGQLEIWKTQKKKELDEQKQTYDAILKAGDAMTAGAKKYLERETPLSEKLSGEAKALDAEKLKTEPGKDLLYQVGQNQERIANVKRVNEFNEKYIEKTKASNEALKERYQDVDKQVKAGEAFIKDRRTELDNILEMEGMTLEQKVDFLQSRPKPVRDRMQKQLDAEIVRLNQLNILETKSEVVEFQEPQGKVEGEPINWKPIEQLIAKIKSATVEQLKKDDPNEASTQADYEKAGGDPALLEKKVAQWKTKVEDAANAKKGRTDDFQNRSEKLRAQSTEADQQEQSAKQTYEAYQGVLDSKKLKMKEFEKKVDPASFFKNFTEDEKVQYKLLQKEIPRLETQVKDFYEQWKAALASKTSAAKLNEAEKQRFEQMIDPSRTNLPKPTSDDIHKMPLRAKYFELTGKTVTGGI